METASLVNFPRTAHTARKIHPSRRRCLADIPVVLRIEETAVCNRVRVIHTVARRIVRVPVIVASVVVHPERAGLIGCRQGTPCVAFKEQTLELGGDVTAILERHHVVLVRIAEFHAVLGVNGKPLVSDARLQRPLLQEDIVCMRGTGVATCTDDHRTGTGFKTGSHVVVRGQVAGSGTHESKFAVLARSAIPVKTDFGTGIVDTRIGGIFAGTVMHHPCAIGHEVGIVVAVARLVVVADANNGRLVGSLHVAVSLRNDQAIAPERLVTDIRGTDTDHELRIPVATVHLANDCLVHTTRERMVVKGGRCLTRTPGTGFEQGAGVADVLEFHRVAADVATIHPEGAECLALRDGAVKLHEVVTVGTGDIHHIEIKGLEGITFGRSARIDTAIFLPGLCVDDDTVALRDIDIPETVRDKARIRNPDSIATVAASHAGTAVCSQAHAGGRILDDLTFGQRSIRCRFFNREEVGIGTSNRFAVCSEGERAHRMHPVVSRKGGRTDRCVDVAAGHHGIGTDCKGTIATNRSRIVAHGDAIQATEGNGAFTEGIGFVSETHAVPGVPVVFKTALRVGMVA